MTTDFYRKYIDIINENSQPPILTEGVLDKIKSIVPKAMALLGKDKLKSIAQQVKQITGGDYSLTQSNAIKVAKALGFDSMVDSKTAQVNEGISGTWQGKLLQLLHLIGVGAGAYSAIPGMTDGPMRVVVAAGLILLMVTHTFWGNEEGQIGSWGRDEEV